jgi:hypothetical protein
VRFLQLSPLRLLRLSHPAPFLHVCQEEMSMLATKLRVRALAAVSACVLGAGTAGAADAIAHATARPATAHAGQSVTFQVKQVLDGMRLRHSFVHGGKRRSARLTQPEVAPRTGSETACSSQHGAP